MPAVGYYIHMKSISVDECLRLHKELQPTHLDMILSHSQVKLRDLGQIVDLGVQIRSTVIVARME
jgi:hypothetical protein